MAMEAWEPTSRQLSVARLLASGDYTIPAAAETVGVSERTIKRWNTEARFRELVRSFWAEAWDQIEGKVVMTGPAAARVVSEVIAGTRPADDIYDAARWLLSRLLNRIDRSDGGSPNAAQPGIEVSQSVRVSPDVAARLIAALEHDRATAGIEYRVDLIAGELATGEPAVDPPSD